MKPLKALLRFKERQAEGQLDARGLSIRDHYRRWHPGLLKRLEEKGEAAQFFLRRQEDGATATTEGIGSPGGTALGVRFSLD